MPEKLWIPPRPNISSVDSDPLKTTRQKILEIKKSRIRITKTTDPDVFKTWLPHTKGVRFHVTEDSPEMELFDIDLGNKKLYGHGIGTRLMERVIHFSLVKNPDLRTVRRGEANWALAMALAKVVGGSEHISFEKSGVTYGEGGERPVESVLVDHPPVEGHGEYNLHQLVASIDPDRLMDRDAAEHSVKITPKRQLG